MRTPDNLYYEYLCSHVQKVQDIYEDILRPVLKKEGVPNELLSEIHESLLSHDRSKHSEEEWSAYRNKFYDKEKYPGDPIEYLYAWNHHQKSNPHHWQYWCLINDVDEPQVQPLDMPFKYIVEMLCDWHSAGLHYGNTAYEWYMRQKDRMILSEKTREIVEKYIVYLK